MPVQYDTIINASQIRGASRCGHKNLYFPSLWFYVILLFFIPLFIFISQYLVLYNWCIHSLVHCEKQSFRFDANGALSDCVCRSSGRYLSTASWTNSRYAACCWWPKWTVPFFFFRIFTESWRTIFFISGIGRRGNGGYRLLYHIHANIVGACFPFLTSPYNGMNTQHNRRKHRLWVFDVKKSIE